MKWKVKCAYGEQKGHRNMVASRLTIMERHWGHPSVRHLSVGTAIAPGRLASAAVASGGFYRPSSIPRFWGPFVWLIYHNWVLVVGHQKIRGRIWASCFHFLAVSFQFSIFKTAFARTPKRASS
jgi:hypothetical protein